MPFDSDLAVREARDLAGAQSHAEAASDGQLIVRDAREEAELSGHADSPYGCTADAKALDRNFTTLKGTEAEDGFSCPGAAPAGELRRQAGLDARRGGRRNPRECRRLALGTADARRRTDVTDQGGSASVPGLEGKAMEEVVTAGDLMTPDPVTVPPEASIAEVWDLMRERDIRHVPVVEGSVLVGMLSDRDLGRLDIARALTGEGAEALRRELATAVVNVMNPDVIAIEPDTDLSEVVELLLEHKVGALPVVEPDTREVVGIVSYIDVLRGLYAMLEEE